MSADRRATHLIETDELAALIASGDSTLRIVDIRGAVLTQTAEDGYQTATYHAAPDEYAQGHLPGAVFVDWTRDIVDENDPVPAQIAPPEKMAQVLGQKGLGDAHPIVVYDANPASQMATRFWWALRYYGHANVRVLNGGWAKWTREGRPITTDLPDYPPAIFTPQTRPEGRATAEETLQLMENPDAVLLDARDEGQYTGRIRRGKYGGHIPSARSLPREAMFAPNGTFRSLDEMEPLFQEQGVTPEKRVVAYCNGGVAATVLLFSLSMLGHPHLTNYDGSWNEWGQRDDLPHEKT